MLKIIYVSLIWSMMGIVISATNSSETIASSWIVFVKEAGHSLKACSTNITTTTWSCLKQQSLNLFDKVISSDVVPLTDSARLIRYRDKPFTNGKWIRKRIFLHKSSTEVYPSWSEHIIEKIADLLTTHVFQMDLYQSATGMARHRHRHHHMLPMMAFGMTALGMVMVPIGFQFLAMLSGKALLLSKMALMLASMNGLKRVATSGVHYGFYHTDPHLLQHNSAWDRGEHPRALLI